MQDVKLEHVNVTVSDPKATAALLERLFGWHVRWQGPSQMGGYSVHVGEADSYIALYTPDAPAQTRRRPGGVRGGLNHIAVVVDDLEAIDARVQEAGFQTFNHADYAPGRRFYFYDSDEIEYEVVSYT